MQACAVQLDNSFTASMENEIHGKRWHCPAPYAASRFPMHIVFIDINWSMRKELCSSRFVYTALLGKSASSGPLLFNAEYSNSLRGRVPKVMCRITTQWYCLLLTIQILLCMGRIIFWLYCSLFTSTQFEQEIFWCQFLWHISSTKQFLKLTNIYKYYECIGNYGNQIFYWPKDIWGWPLYPYIIKWVFFSKLL